MTKQRKLSSVELSGSRAEQLKCLASVLALQIDICSQDAEKGPQLLPSLARQYRETIRELEEIEGVNDDDGIGEILSAREADGQSGAVR